MATAPALFERMRIGTRIAIAFGGIAVAFAVAAGLVQYDLYRIAQVDGELTGALARLDGSSAQLDPVRAQAAQIGQWIWDTRLGAAIVGTIAGIVAVLATWGVARSISRPIGRAVEVAELVASGDLSQRTGAQGDDEISHLLQAMDRMSAHLSERVQRVRDAADTIATASREIAAGNSDLSSRTEQQATSIERTAEATERLNTTIHTGRQTASGANGLAGEARDFASQGREVVDRVVQRMDEISASSRRIGEIIGMIDGIAFQTNILALNAAVEAARAGEQGRGFAVVAGEVRSLAQRSAQAAHEIKELIGASVNDVTSGQSLVRDAGETMSVLLDRVLQVSELIGSISAAAGEQTTGIEQINHSVVLLEQTTQQNAALVEQSAAAADGLRQQADELREAVSLFRLA